MLQLFSIYRAGVCKFPLLFGELEVEKCFFFSGDLKILHRKDRDACDSGQQSA
jgi:hypothetical protein